MSERSATQGPASAEAGRLMRLATYASVGVAGILIVTKFAAWLVTDSVSLLSTLIDSLLDVAASMVNLLAVRHALTPADKEHRFGHGKAEPLAALGQSTFIAGSAVFLLFEAGHVFREREGQVYELVSVAFLILRSPDTPATRPSSTLLSPMNSAVNRFCGVS